MFVTTFTAPDAETVPVYLRNRTVIIRWKPGLLRANYKTRNGEWCQTSPAEAMAIRLVARAHGQDVDFI